MTTTEFLRTWIFSRGEDRKEISFIVSETTEAQARSAMARRGEDVTGWEAGTRAEKVECGPAADPDAPEQTYAVQFSRTQWATVEVKAKDEDEAVELAKKDLTTLHSWDWDTDGYSADFESVEVVD